MAGTGGQDTYESSPPTTVFESNHTRDASEQCVVLTSPYVLSRFEARTPLANDDGTAAYDLSAEGFDTQTLRVRISPVSGTTLTFFMCHGSLASLGLYFFDPNRGKELSVPPSPSVPFSAFLLENEDLGALTLFQDDSSHAGAIDIRASHFDGSVAVQHQNFVERHRGAHFCFEFLDPDLFTRGNLHLLTAAFNYCVQKSPPSPTEILRFYWLSTALSRKEPAAITTAGPNSFCILEFLSSAVKRLAIVRLPRRVNC